MAQQTMLLQNRELIMAHWASQKCAFRTFNEERQKSTRPKPATILRSSRAQYVVFILQPRALGPTTEHESFCLVADLVYADGESARNKKIPLFSNGAVLDGPLQYNHVQSMEIVSGKHA